MLLNENEYRGTHGNLRLGRAYKTEQGQRSLNQESPGFSRGECQDTAEQVASKIKASVDAAIAAETLDNWTVSVDGADILFIKDTVGVCVAPTATDTGLTGVTFSTFARQNEGVAAVWASFLT